MEVSSLIDVICEASNFTIKEYFVLKTTSKLSK